MGRYLMLADEVVLEHANETDAPHDQNDINDESSKSRVQTATLHRTEQTFASGSDDIEERAALAEHLGGLQRAV